MKLLFGLMFFCLVHFTNSDMGKVTTWRNDPTGKSCNDIVARMCDTGELLCSAPMRSCPCPMKPAAETDPNNMFKRLCNSGSIDYMTITETDRNNCLTCRLNVCDLPDFPSCPVSCGTPICINGVQTYETDACPSNHQKNVAKCCIWGGEYCSCVNGSWIDVNSAAMDKLGCGSKCDNAKWDYNRMCSGHPPSTPQNYECGNRLDDIPPPGQSYTCQQQKEWGKCNYPWMKGFCCKSCSSGNRGRKLIEETSNSNCHNRMDDTPPPGHSYTCQQQKQWGQCNQPWMQGYCCKSCAKTGTGGQPSTTSCHNRMDDIPPPGQSHTCQQQKQWGKCNQPWMQGYCCKSCANVGTGGQPSTTCHNRMDDIPPPGNSYTCQQQKQWGQCNQPWMQGYCCRTCANAGTQRHLCTDVPPPSSQHTCQQQKQWGKCNHSWMHGYCRKSCGKC